MGCGASSRPSKVSVTLPQSSDKDIHVKNAVVERNSVTREDNTSVVKPVDRIRILNVSTSPVDEEREVVQPLHLEESCNSLDTDSAEKEKQATPSKDLGERPENGGTNHANQEEQVPPTTTLQENLQHFDLSDMNFDRILGEGSFGRVYLVQSRVRGNHYALKRMNMDVVIRLKQVDHINNERRIWANLCHPFICRLWGASRDDRYLYLLLELAHGGELFTMLRRAGRFSEEAAKFYAAETALALDYLHKNDILYRGLKPEDILISRYGHVKLTDFGFAKVVSNDNRTYTLCGTPEYLPPEVLLNKGHGKPADCWTFGVLVYEMLAGQPPFCDEDPMGIYQKILAGKVYFPRFVSSEAKRLMKGLLRADVKTRLSFPDIFPHPWFKDIDWDLCMAQAVPPPDIPTIEHDGDVSRFEHYSEASSDNPSPVIQPSVAEACFPDF